MTSKKDITVITDFFSMTKYNSFGIVTSNSNIEPYKSIIESWYMLSNSLVLADKDGLPVVSFYELDEDEVIALKSISEVKMALTDHEGAILEAYQIEKHEKNQKSTI